MDSPASPLPVNYECLGCLYDMSAAASRTCPECGRRADAGDLEAFSLRDHAVVQVPGLLALSAIAGAVICGVFAAGVAILTGSVMQAGEACLVCGLAVCGSTGVGAIASLFARKKERAAHFVIWLRSQYLLKGPWLCAPVSGLILLAAYVGSFRPVSHGGFDAAMLVTLIGLLVWLVASGLCGLWWMGTFLRGRRRMKLRGGVVVGVFVVAAAGTLLGAMALGIAAGALSLSSAERFASSKP